MNDINDIQDQIIAEFEDFTDWLDRYSLIIEMGNALPPLDEKYKTESNLIDGCQSRVWLHSELDDEGRLHFTADSDAIIVKGIIAMLLRVLSDRQPQEIHRAAGQPVAHAQQRPVGNGETHPRHSPGGQRQRHLPRRAHRHPLIMMNF